MTDSPATRGTLLLRLRDRQDADAWGEFLRDYGPMLYRFVRSRGLQVCRWPWPAILLCVQTLATIFHPLSCLAIRAPSGPLISRLMASSLLPPLMGAARVWDLATGKSVVTLRGHASAVHNVSLDPSAHRIATSSRDGTIRIWDMNRLVRD